MHSLSHPDIVAAIRMERQANALEVAEAFIAAFGSPDAAEHILDMILHARPEHDPGFWRDVQTALAQIRG